MECFNISKETSVGEGENCRRKNIRETVEFWKVLQAFSSYLVFILRNMGSHWGRVENREKYDIS